MRFPLPALALLPLVTVGPASLSQSTLSFELSQNSAKLGLSGVANAVQADFNNDGKPDLITQDPSIYGDKQAKFSLRLGNGDGTFQTPVQVGAIPFDVVPTVLTSDVNRDGNPDLILISSSEISVQLGTGTGTFGQPVVSAISGVNQYSYYVRYAPGDFNGDGFTDIAGLDGNGHVVIYQNVGGGKFTAVKTISAALPGGSIDTFAAGDVDGDGKTDLAVSESTSSTTSIDVLWGLGNNNFRDAALKTYTYAQLAVIDSVGDLNGDGTPDILVESSCKTTYSPVGKGSPQDCTSIDAFYGGQGPQAVFYRHLVDDPSVSSAGVQPIDVNGDGIADLAGGAALLNSSQGGLAFWLGQPDGSFAQTAQTFSVTSDGTGYLVTGDFNRDGKTDFLLAGDNGGNPNLSTVALFLNATPQAACATSRISPTVVACQPVDNTYIAGPNIHVQATAYDNTQVTALQEYIDGKLLYSQPETMLDMQFPENLGPHLLVTKAWDAKGISFRTNRHVTVYDGTPGAVCTAAPNSASICLPAGATASSPVRVLANGATMAIPTAVQLYVDGALAVNDTTHSTVLDVNQTLSSGPHQLVFKLYDANRGVFTATKNITVQ